MEKVMPVLDRLWREPEIKGEVNVILQEFQIFLKQ